jgi:large subunit ribosomal protein L6
MSRIGKKPIAIPAGITVTVQGDEVKMKGPKGELKHRFDRHVVAVESAGGELRVSRSGEERQHRAQQGLTRALLSNMLTGCTTGFKKELDISGVGYQAKVAGAKLTLQIGFCHPVEMAMPAGIKVEATSPTHLVVSGPDRQLVGQVAADIRGIRPPEPYNAKGIKYSDEVIRRKAGKTVAAK